MIFFSRIQALCGLTRISLILFSSFFFSGEGRASENLKEAVIQQEDGSTKKSPYKERSPQGGKEGNSTPERELTEEDDDRVSTGFPGFYISKKTGLILPD